MNTIAAFLTIWALDPSGAGTVTITPQPSVRECWLAGAARPDLSTSAACASADDYLRDVEVTGYLLATNRCAVVTQNDDVQVWTCKGRE